MRFGDIDGRLALSTSDGWVDVARASAGQFTGTGPRTFDAWPELTAWAAELGSLQPLWLLGPAHLAGDRFGPPVSSPRQVFGIGLNYRDHIQESNLDIPERPAVFTKFATCLTGPCTPVALPSDFVDWEVELVVVLGRRCEHVAERDAWGHVAGVTVGQDLSERQVQLAGPMPQFSLGKSYPGFGPLGPALVTPDELTDPDDLALGCALDGGEVLQQGRTSDLVFAVPELLARLSAVCPLLPGDVVFTGTPSGVGGARTPPQFLRPGQVLRSWVESVGEMRTPLISAT